MINYLVFVNETRIKQWLNDAISVRLLCFEQETKTKDIPSFIFIIYERNLNWVTYFYFSCYSNHLRQSINREQKNINSKKTIHGNQQRPSNVSEYIFERSKSNHLGSIVKDEDKRGTEIQSCIELAKDVS